MKTPLWTPSEERKRTANITRFMDAVNQRFGLTLASYSDLYDWSVNNIPDFWLTVWDFAEIKASKQYDSVVTDLSVFPGTQWFPGAKLNFAENLLRYRDDGLAFIFKGETHSSKQMTYAELYDSVARLSKSLAEAGVGVGDRVVGYMPNLIETVIGMLAATSLGATWSSCATDIGAGAAIERLGQVEPKVMITADGYFYKGKVFETLSHAAEVAGGIPSLEKVIVVSYVSERADAESVASIPNAVHYADFLSKDAGEIQFAQLPFDHPLYIMFSSGTTGKPKCLVQGAGGVLINHLKELLLHTDLKRSDRIFYITSCSWMMWNWLMSSLAVGATIVLYDGNPNFPDAGAMWKLIQDEQITIFGCSASYLHFLKKESELSRNRQENLKHEGHQVHKGGKVVKFYGLSSLVTFVYFVFKKAFPLKTVEPKNISPCSFDLSSLREISQTGSPLSADGFEYVYREIKSDLHFNSIAGGTDINGCFAAGSPIVPVYAGELQSPALGMKIKSYDEKANPIWDEQGELVCEAPAPSMPLYFWNDPDGSKYHRAYFDVYSNVWRHGDYVLIHKDTGGITFYGRSDAVLKPSGVRIGTAEIYAQMENLPEVADSLAVGQNYQDDQRVILFVKLAAGVALTDELQNKIRKTLRENASPRHVPALILATPEIPYTLNMKKVESAVTNILNGRAVSNRDALINPGSLEFYEGVVEKLK